MEFRHKKRRIKRLEKSIDVAKMYFDEHMRPQRIAAALGLTAK